MSIRSVLAGWLCTWFAGVLSAMTKTILDGWVCREGLGNIVDRGLVGGDVIVAGGAGRMSKDVTDGAGDGSLSCR